MKPREILLLCTGNVCRSPLAEALLARELAARGAGARFRVSSAGFWRDDVPADPKSVAVAKSRGLDLRDHRSRIFTPVLAAQADLVLGMEERHAQRARDLGCPQAYAFAPYASLGRDLADIEDPVGKAIELFEACALKLEELVPGAADRILLEFPG